MKTARGRHPPIDEALALFLTSHLSIQVAACDDDGVPTLVCALGARISPDRQYLTVLLPGSQSEAVLRCIATNRRIAVVFNEPETHRTVQLKGRDASIEAAMAQDEARLPGYIQAMTQRLQHFKVPEAFCRAFFSAPPGDLVAVTFTPVEAYGQTPGPHAGERLDAHRAAP